MADDLSLFYKRNKKSMERTIFKILHDPQLIEDALQEAFLRICSVYEKLKFYDIDTELAYSVQVARNAAIDLYKRQQHDMPLDETISLEDPAYKIIVEKEAVSELLQLLDPKARAIFYFRDIGLSDKEISKSLGISVSNVRTIVYRTRE